MLVPTPRRPLSTCCTFALPDQEGSLKSSRVFGNIYQRTFKMMNYRIAVAVALVFAVVCLAEAREEGPSAHEMADALRMLQELDRYYTQASRPRIDRRDVADGDRVDPELLDRAMRLIQLQNLDRIYSYHTRPRFGKRSEAFSNWAKDMEKPDLPAWLSYVRRR